MRISHGPYTTLGVVETATLEQVRSAFLALTKQFHPARFGRMAIDIQRLSNEVFLGIKSAHDSLVKTLGGGKRAAMQSGGMPVIQSEGSGRTVQPRQSTGSIPTVQPRSTGQIPTVARPATPTFARGTDRPTSPSGSPPERTSSPTIPRTTTPMQPARTTSPIPARTTTPPLGTPVQRPTTPATMRPATPTGSRPATPPSRPGTPPGAAPRPPPASAINPDTVRGTVAPREPAFDERAALRESLMHINDESWAAARATLSTLATKVPQSKNYRALLGYVRGREAQAAGKTEEAALEYQRALELDPGLTMAKQALAEVQRRR